MKAVQNPENNEQNHPKILCQNWVRLRKLRLYKSSIWKKNESQKLDLNFFAEKVQQETPTQRKNKFMEKTILIGPRKLKS